MIGSLLVAIVFPALPTMGHQPVPPGGRRGPCATVSAATSEWKEVAGSRFTFRLPRAYADRSVLPDDAHNDLETGTWVNGDRKVAYQSGVGTNPLAVGEPKLDRLVCEATIGGHVARIVTGRTTEGAFVAAGYWVDLGRISVGPTSFTMYGEARDAEGQRELLGILWTLHFSN
jgi:hypothetical protein